MSHHKHTTEAFILTVKAIKEGDARIKLITKDGEVLSAIASGLRLLKSKLRMAVVPYGHARVSIVKGKEVWRLTNAEPITDFYQEIESTAAKKALARIASLVEKLTPGEGIVGNTFERLIAYSQMLVQGVAREKIKVYETQAALHILFELGYIENAEKWNNASVEYIEAHLVQAVQDVNHGIASADLS